MGPYPFLTSRKALWRFTPAHSKNSPFGEFFSAPGGTRTPVDQWSGDLQSPVIAAIRPAHDIGTHITYHRKCQKTSHLGLFFLLLQRVDYFDISFSPTCTSDKTFSPLPTFFTSKVNSPSFMPMKIEPPLMRPREIMSDATGVIILS